MELALAAVLLGGEEVDQGLMTVVAEADYPVTTEAAYFRGHIYTEPARPRQRHNCGKTITGQVHSLVATTW